VGIIHCDIKPENILSVSRDAPVPLKVADFGLAKATEALRSRLTRMRSTTWAASSTPGTLDYMSPEQTVSRDRVTEASDVYSLGIIFYVSTNCLPAKRPLPISPRTTRFGAPTASSSPPRCAACPVCRSRWCGWLSPCSKRTLAGDRRRQLLLRASATSSHQMSWRDRKRA
jgi:serine/threonine protein kinase